GREPFTVLLDARCRRRPSDRTRPRQRVTSHERRNRDFWDGDADAYQAVHAPDLERAPRAWGVWRVPEADLGALGDVVGRDVLEFGCGAAQWSVALARAGARPVGLDQSRAQLRHARRLQQEHG